jgi:thioredoxin-related protein
MMTKALSRLALWTIFLIILPSSLAAEAPPPTADAVVSSAVKSAMSGNKMVLIEFGASWCTWCRSFDAFVHAPEVRQIISDNYVIANLTVQEREDKKALENAGAQDRMDQWGGAKSGLPYYVFLNGAGRKIADSNAMPDGSNIGFPGTPQELQAFMSLLDKTAPRMSPPGRAAILAYLNKVLKQ